jgi:hypothetical protein
MVIHMVILWLERAPPGSVWIDPPVNVSRENATRAVALARIRL